MTLVYKLKYFFPVVMKMDYENGEEPLQSLTPLKEASKSLNIREKRLLQYVNQELVESVKTGGSYLLRLDTEAYARILGMCCLRKVPERRKMQQLSRKKLL